MVELKDNLAGDQDHFFLGHLQSVKGNKAWYYNHRFIGRGGNGTAFLVSCSSGALFGLQLVLKVFHRISDAKRRQAFLQEIAHLQTLRHPAIIDIYDEGEFNIDGRIYPFAVVEYVPITARQLLVAGQIDLLRAICIASNCLSALQHIHSAKPAIIHRDLKPENILISPAAAKLADFGLAKAVNDQADAAEEVADAVASSQWPGMPYRYRTPELIKRARGEKNDITTASDIYQFGTVFYELLTGFNPQRPTDKVLDDIQLDIRYINGNEGGYLTTLIRDMMQEDPTKRPAAAVCLKRLDLIHHKLCEQMAKVTGQPM